MLCQTGTNYHREEDEQERGGGEGERGWKISSGCNVCALESPHVPSPLFPNIPSAALEKGSTPDRPTMVLSRHFKVDLRALPVSYREPKAKTKSQILSQEWGKILTAARSSRFTLKFIKERRFYSGENRAVSAASLTQYASLERARHV